MSAVTLSTAGIGPPVRGEHISLETHVIGVHVHSKDAYGQRNTLSHKIRALWDRTSELLRQCGSPDVRGEHISLENACYSGVHIHSKDAYGQEEHAPHKIRDSMTAAL